MVCGGVCSEPASMKPAKSICVLPLAIVIEALCRPSCFGAAGYPDAGDLPELQISQTARINDDDDR